MITNFDERTLPTYLKKDLDAWKNKQEDNSHIWDCLWGELYGSINCAETDFEITSEVAWHLREKYLGLTKES